MNVDVSELKEHLEKFVLPLEAVAQSAAFAGWSVQSSNGSYQDGWHKGHLLLKESQDPQAVKESLLKMGGQLSSAYVLPTEICHGYLQKVMTKIISFQLNPRRARIIRLSPNTSCMWHRDSPDNLYCVRLHIPILTNPGCYFETRDERAHLPADGNGYFLRVNREHRVTNEGDTYRYHLVMDVTDTHGVTEFHRQPTKSDSNLANVE